MLLLQSKYCQNELAGITLITMHIYYYDSVVPMRKQKQTQTQRLPMTIPATFPLSFLRAFFLASSSASSSVPPNIAFTSNTAPAAAAACCAAIAAAASAALDVHCGGLYTKVGEISALSVAAPEAVLSVKTRIPGMSPEPTEHSDAAICLHAGVNGAPVYVVYPAAANGEPS